MRCPFSRRRRISISFRPASLPAACSALGRPRTTTVVSRDGMPERAREIFDSIRHRVPAEFDEGGSIGKRYRRQDEIGTPWGITVDGQTLEDDTVTLRDRDTLEQERVPAGEVGDLLAARLAEPWASPKLS